MTTIQQKFWMGALVAVSIFLMTCKKETLDIPNTECEKLFGKWDWVRSYESGQFINPQTEGYSMQVEYQKNGIYKNFKGGEKKDKMRFKFVEGNTYLSLPYKIEYKDTWPGNTTYSESFRFGGQDTLYLFDDYCSTCDLHIYVKL